MNVRSVFVWKSLSYWADLSILSLQDGIHIVKYITIIAKYIAVSGIYFIHRLIWILVYRLSQNSSVNFIFSVHRNGKT